MISGSELDFEISSSMIDLIDFFAIQLISTAVDFKLLSLH